MEFKLLLLLEIFNNWLLKNISGKEEDDRSCFQEKAAFSVALLFSLRLSLEFGNHRSQPSLPLFISHGSGIGLGSVRGGGRC